MAKPYNEMYQGGESARSHYRRYAQWFNDQPEERLAQKRAEADALFHRVGITEHHGYSDTIGDLKFASLHGAFWSGGTFLYVPRNVIM